MSFSFTNNQIEKLRLWKTQLTSDKALKWKAEEDEAARVSIDILSGQRFKQGQDLDKKELIRLFSKMHKFARNQSLNKRLIDGLNDAADFNRLLRDLIHGSGLLVDRIDKFLELNGVGKQTVTQFLCAYDRNRYPLVSNQTLSVLGLSTKQLDDASMAALERYKIIRKRDYRDGTLEVVRDMLIFEALKDLLQLENFNEANNLLWIQKNKQPPEADKGAREEEKHVVFFNVCWLEKYQGGSEDISGCNFKWPKKNGEAGEVCNFNVVPDGRCYGFVNPPGENGSISIGRIGADAGHDRADNILVVWTAARPGGGKRVVGWYRHATVLGGDAHFTTDESDKKWPRGKFRVKGKMMPITIYNSFAAAEDCFLLTLDEREWAVPTGKGMAGQAPVWYAEENPKFVEEIRIKIVDYETSVRFRRLLESRRQLILCGPPGTGKTYLTRSIAVDLIKH